MPEREKIKMPASVFAFLMKFGLRYVGMWPNASCSLFYRCGWILTTTIVQTCQYWYLILRFKTEDLSELTDGLSVAMEYTVMFTKLIILWFNTRHCNVKVRTVPWTLENELDNSICTVNCAPRESSLLRYGNYPSSAQHKSLTIVKRTDRVNCRSIFNDVLATIAADWRKAAVNDVQIMTDKASLSRYFSNIIIGLHLGAAFSYVIGVLVQSSQNDVDESGIPIREFTLKLQLPFECNQSPIYEVIQSLEFLHQLSASFVTGMLNSLVITFVLHVCGQIEILCDILEGITPGEYDQCVSSFAGKLVVRHQKIIAFSDKVEKIFCYIALMQFISSTLVICCLGYMMVASISNLQNSESVDIPALMKAMVFYVAATVEAFIFCFCGEYLTAKSKMIGDAAYKSLWYDLKPDQNKFILLIMLRSQRRLTITTGKMMDLSLEGFTTIIKASVSYISVLHAMS